jgi:hypothetical protein
VCVVFEWRRAQEQNVSAEGGDRRDCSPAGIAGVARGTPESLRFIHDEKIDSRSHSVIGQLRSIDQHVD